MICFAISIARAILLIFDVINTVCDKLIHRHPHIYGDVEVADEIEVKKNWEKLKLKEERNLF